MNYTTSIRSNGLVYIQKPPKTIQLVFNVFLLFLNIVLLYEQTILAIRTWNNSILCVVKWDYSSKSAMLTLNTHTMDIRIQPQCELCVEMWKLYYGHMKRTEYPSITRFFLFPLSLTHGRLEVVFSWFFVLSTLSKDYKVFSASKNINSPSIGQWMLTTYKLKQNCFKVQHIYISNELFSVVGFPLAYIP